MEYKYENTIASEKVEIHYLVQNNILTATYRGRTVSSTTLLGIKKKISDLKLAYSKASGNYTCHQTSQNAPQRV